MKKILIIPFLFLLLGANVSNIKKMTGDGIVVQSRDGVSTLIKASPSLLNLSNANYTITPTDNYDTIFVTTGGSDRTITLPSVASGFNRKIFFKKVDSGVGHVIIDTPGAETIDQAAQNHLFAQNSYEEIQGEGTGWQVLRAWDYIVQDTGSNTVAGTGNVYHDVGAAVSVPEGEWFINCNLRYDRNGSTAFAYINSFPGTTTGNNGAQACSQGTARGWDFGTGISTTAWTTLTYEFAGCRMLLTSVTNVFHKGLYNITTNASQFTFSGHITFQRRK